MGQAMNSGIRELTVFLNYFLVLHLVIVVYIRERAGFLQFRDTKHGRFSSDE